MEMSNVNSHAFLQNSVFYFCASIMKPATLRPFLPRPAIRRRSCISRTYAVQTPDAPTLQVFNRHTKHLQKERAAANVDRSRQVDYLKDEVAVRLCERLLVRFNRCRKPISVNGRATKSTFRTSTVTSRKSSTSVRTPAILLAPSPALIPTWTPLSRTPHHFPLACPTS